MAAAGKYQYLYEYHVSDDYTERGVADGAKVTLDEIPNKDLRDVATVVRESGLMEALAWLDENRENFSPTTLVTATTKGEKLETFRKRNPDTVIFTTPLNVVVGLNFLLARCNDLLPRGGWMACHSRTAMLKKQAVLRKYPFPLNRIINLLHYIWHRVFPKLNETTRHFYFRRTRGKNRTYNRVEILGRICRAGFEIMHEEFIHEEYFVLARKIKDPIEDDEPTGSPIIKLHRVGLNGEMIPVHKFRTMYSYSEYLQPYIYAHEGLQKGGKFADDYRVNEIGRFMRKCWLDELPMIIDIWRGNMKWIGVRPLSPHYLSLYSPQAQALHTSVKPGLLPPFYYEKKTPETIEEIEASERRYIEAYHKHPRRTDWRYFWGIAGNILFHRKRSH